MADTGVDLKRYSDLDDVEIAEGDPDVRGWDVVAADGHELGEVKDLIVDTGAMKVRYLETELDRDTYGLKDDRDVLIPVDTVQLDRDDDHVVLDRMSWQDLGRLPAFTGQAIDAEYWRGFKAQPAVQSERAAATSAPAAAGATGKRLTRAEEELRIGKRAVQKGDVRIGKHVETEHVSQPVSRKRERVDVERRPVSGGNAEARIGSGQQETRVPIVEEEVVVEKRPVVKEELVVNKETVEDTQNVEADLRKERVDVEREGDTKVNKDDVSRRGGH